MFQNGVGYIAIRSKKAQTSDKKSQPKPVTKSHKGSEKRSQLFKKSKSHKGSDKKSSHSSNNKEVTLSYNISSSKENKTTYNKKRWLISVRKLWQVTDGIHTKNATKKYEQLGEDKFIRVS